jgi:hypothetical protein
MNEEEAMQKLSEWNSIADLKLTNGMTFTEYHIDRIKREKDGVWDSVYAEQYVNRLIANMREKYQ